MAKYAIVRADGSVDTADGMSVQDIADQYGAPGDGSIEAYDEDTHGAHVINEFTSPADQRAAWETVAAAEGQPGYSSEDDS